MLLKGKKIVSLNPFPNNTNSQTKYGYAVIYNTSLVCLSTTQMVVNSTKDLWENIQASVIFTNIYHEYCT